MKRTLLFFFFLTAFSLFAQQRKGEFYLAPGSDAHALYVSFTSEVVFAQDKHEEALSQSAEIKKLILDYGITFQPGIPLSESKLNELYLAARKNGSDGKSVLKLKNILKISIPDPSNERLFALAGAFEKLPFVEYSSLMTLRPIAPPSDIAPATPDYEVNQTYLDANPGVNMRYAWGLGLSGTGIRIRDVEYGFNKNHEELVDRNTSIAAGMTISSSATSSYTEHGTSVFGIMYADKGNYGVSGMAYNAAEMILFPEWQQSGYNRVTAVTAAIQNSVAGDVILYEMQAYGQGSNYVPAEFDNPVWDLTKAATDAGIVIVEAAANGNQNLDAAFYAPYMARGNSGAIVVGGGTANLAHNRISYSTYGSRVDLQGWSTSVRASGYGDVIMIGGDFNQSYTNFSGTSSATPIVASCAVVLQSYYHSLTGNYMTGAQLRLLMQQTGIPQGSDVAGNIGPLPDMQAAITQLNQTLGVAENEALHFTVFPNPVGITLSVLVPNVSSEAAYAEIYDTLGQQLLRQPLKAGVTEIAADNLAKGVYFVKIVDAKKSAVKRFIKK